MKCPLLQRYLIQGEDNALECLDNCLKEECAWWDKDRKQCSELSKTGALVAINSTLDEIAGKMPSGLKARL